MVVLTSLGVESKFVVKIVSLNLLVAFIKIILLLIQNFNIRTPDMEFMRLDMPRRNSYIYKCPGLQQR
jgi:hypothetical protein